MRSVRSIAVIALLTACQFKSPVGDRTDAGADAPIDAPIDMAIDTPPPGPWLDGWARRKRITLNNAQIEAPGNGALANFPVLVSVIDTQIAASALSNGADIVFTSDDAMTVLSSEIESFIPVSNLLVAWVKVPTLPATTDTTLYVYYGNPSPPMPRQPPPETVWTESYHAVWHLHQNPGQGGNGNIRDATSGGHHGTAMQMNANNSMRAQIGAGLSFDGQNDYIDFNTMDFGDTFTLSMWVRWAGGNLNQTLMANTPGGGNQNGFRYFINSADSMDRRVVFEVGNGQPGSAELAQTDVNAVTQDVFTHITLAVNRNASRAFIYLNANRADMDMTTRNDFSTSSDFEIGRMENNVLFYPGLLDEVQLASTVRDPEWIRTAYNNQASPAAFHTLGDEEQRP